VTPKTNEEAKRQSRPLPPGWRWVRLNDVLTALESGSRPRGGVQRIKEGYLSIGAEHILEFGTLDLANPRYVPKGFFNTLRKGKIKQGDVLLVKDGATTGRVALVRSELGQSGAAINEHVFLLRPDHEIHSLYLFFALASPSGQQAIRRCYHGAAQGGITQEFAQAVWLPLPSLLEQRTIIARLEAQMSEVQHMRQVAERQLEAARQLRFSLVAQAMAPFSEAGGKLHEALVSPPKSGWPLAYDNQPDGTPFLTISAILNFQYDGAQVKYTNKPVDDNADYWAKKGDILMSRSNTPDLVGHAAIYDGTPERVIFPDLLIRLEVDTICADVRFAYYWLMSPTARSYITSNARGSSGTMKKITLGMVRDIPFPVHLSIEQQSAIASAIEHRVKEATRIFNAAERQLEAINALPGALLREVFGGFEPPPDEG